MNLRVLCVGKLKERYWEEAVSEYQKRLQRFASVTITELKEERLPERSTAGDERKVIAAESHRLSEQISAKSYVIALDRTGRMLDSPELAKLLDELALTGKSEVTFLIGGSLGLSDELLKQADVRLSFSKFTFPHQLMRVILLEQIYRAFKILCGETYHK